MSAPTVEYALRFTKGKARGRYASRIPGCTTADEQMALRMTVEEATRRAALFTDGALEPVPLVNVPVGINDIEDVMELYCFNNGYGRWGS